MGTRTLAGRRFGRQGNGKHGQPVDPGRIIVRARVRGHLEALQTRFPDLLGGCEIQDSGGTDYAYRLFVEKSAWTEVSHQSLAQRPPSVSRPPASSRDLGSSRSALGRRRAPRCAPSRSSRKIDADTILLAVELDPPVLLELEGFPSSSSTSFSVDVARILLRTRSQYSRSAGSIAANWASGSSGFAELPTGFRHKPDTANTIAAGMTHRRRIVFSCLTPKRAGRSFSLRDDKLRVFARP